MSITFESVPYPTVVNYVHEWVAPIDERSMTVREMLGQLYSATKRAARESGLVQACYVWEGPVIRAVGYESVMKRGARFLEYLAERVRVPDGPNLPYLIVAIKPGGDETQVCFWPVIVGNEKELTDIAQEGGSN